MGKTKGTLVIGRDALVCLDRRVVAPVATRCDRGVSESWASLEHRWRLEEPLLDCVTDSRSRVASWVEARSPRLAGTMRAVLL